MKRGIEVTYREIKKRPGTAIPMSAQSNTLQIKHNTELLKTQQLTNEGKSLREIFDTLDLDLSLIQRKEGAS